MVDSALDALDQQLADIGEADRAETLRATARALLVVASREEDYDVTLLPASCSFGLRVRNTTFGLQADVTETGGAGVEAGGSKGGDPET